MKDLCFLELNLEGMKHRMMHAFSAHAEDLKKEIETACELYVSSGRLQKQFNEALDKAVQEELDSFFSYGKGRETIKIAVTNLINGEK